MRSISHFDPSTDRFKTCAWDDDTGEPKAVGMDFIILPGKGYRIFGTEAGILVQPGCD
ncbi:MAG: hypothetical protein GY703_24530 [Gammaproteobacteria bacterium]|nr:hypothetical protein [Gammaproteobacteria bacterium]